MEQIDIGAAVRMRRAQSRLTQEQYGMKLDLSAKLIFDAEKGDVSLSAPGIRILRDAFNTPESFTAAVDQLLGAR